MEERLKGILNKVVAFWNKYTAKQKATIISVSAIVIFTLIILGFVLTRPTMVTLITAESTKEAAEVKDILESEGISMEISSDGKVISVNKKDIANATILLGENSIPADGYSITDALSGGFSTTEADKEKKYKLYLESKLEKTLETMDGVKEASVSLTIPENDGTIITQEQDTYASVLLTLSSELSSDAPTVMAKYVATGVGNKTTESIVIIDSNGKLLFSGGDEDSTVGNAGSQFEVKNQAEAVVKKQVKDVMLGTNVYDNIEVAPNLDISFDVVSETEQTYTPAEGQEQGLLSHEEIYENETSGGTAGVPGTDSNSNTTYVIEGSDTSTSATTQTSRDYTPNQKVTNTQYAPGSVNYDSSSVSVVATNYIVYNEDDMKAQGKLDGTTFAEFMAANDVKTKTTVDQDFYTMVSTATGIAEANISIVAYDVPLFQPSTGSGRSWSDYLMIALILLILGLLGFVIFKSTRPIEVLETEPELSVEALLASTKETTTPLDDIDFNEKSDARKLIEKFVDENPAAVAQLLRNWLNEDWE
ncbi:flagellar M-ring protein FliF C-terminal domain-containing protein [Konateibacter massiliensis]|uniref:flagellar M-ring protein FliF C-terminal domain-containing protein n=1 Tax=Konateibacter massiliensis TaxID=2002841 RepID=UPI000C15D461|nr:flagellar M-ring protein FliF C-terminal domain-containing protein [Konateibacter massiliensis]